MRQWSLEHPEQHVSAAVQGRASGEEWRALTDAQKAPFMLRAQQEKARHAILKQQYERRKQRNDEQPGTPQERDHRYEQKQRRSHHDGSEEVTWLRTGAVDEEVTELSPALSSRALRRVARDHEAAEDAAVSDHGGNDMNERLRKRRTLPFDVSPEPRRRPPSAFRLYEAEGLRYLQGRAQQTNTRLLKKDARKVHSHAHLPASLCSAQRLPSFSRAILECALCSSCARSGSR